MRILFGCDYFHPIVGGGEEWNKRVAFELASRGHEITVLTYKVPGFTEDSKLKDVEIKRLGACLIRGTRPYLKRALIQGFGVFKHILFNFNEFDIVQVQAFPLIPAFIALRILRWLGKDIPLVMVWHDVYGSENNFRFKGSWKGGIRNIIENVLLRLSASSSLVLTVSESTRRKLIRNGIPQEKIRVVYGGIVLDDFDEVKTDVTQPSILYVGRLVPEKRVEDLLEAFSLLIEGGIKCDLLIVGCGRWISYLKDYAQNLGISDRVHFTGFITNDDKIRLMKDALLLVLPSVMEGLGLVLLEAMACKTPVVAIDLGGPREVVLDGVNGLLAKPYSPSSLYEKMLKLAQDVELRKEMGEKGREIVESKFTWKSVVTRIERSYDDCLS